MHNPYRTLLRNLLLGGIAASVPLAAQSQTGLQPRPGHEVDLALTYNATRASGIAGTSFFAQGANLDLSAEAYHGVGLALDVSSVRASNINGTNLNLTTVTTVAGPRYTYRRHCLAVFGEALAGQANGFDSRFPGPQGTTTNANVLAVQIGGGVDYALNRHFAIRALQASWLRTQFPNATTNIQNALQLGAGIVFRFAR